MAAMTTSSIMTVTAGDSCYGCASNKIAAGDVVSAAQLGPPRRRNPYRESPSSTVVLPQDLVRDGLGYGRRASHLLRHAEAEVSSAQAPTPAL
jgi:hypothetical protein